MRRSPTTVLAAALALLLPILFTTAVAAPDWLLRYAALAPVVGVGIPLLVSRARDGDSRLPALLGAGFALWCLLSAALSRFPAQSLFGAFGLGTGALFAISLVAAWAIGTSVDDEGPDLVERALLVAAAINVVVAVAEMAFNLQSLGLQLFDGRSAGLLGNPVFLSEFLAGTLWLVLLRAHQRLPLWAAFAAAIGAALQVSGSRLPLALALLAVPLSLIRVPWRTVAVMAVALVLGLGLGAVLTDHGGGTSTSSRLGDSLASGGNRARLETWLSATHAVTERPITGFGPGRYNEGTGPHRTLQLARSGERTIFLDAHNFIVEYATTTGLPGLLLLVGFLVAVVRRRLRSLPLLGFGLIVLAGHLVEPQNVALTPLALLALGAATALPPSERADTATPLLVRLACILIGVAAAAQVVVGGYEFQQGALDFKLGPSHTALRLLPPWPDTAGLMARVYTFQAKTTRHRPDLDRLALRWRHLAAGRSPDQATFWLDLGEAQLAAGDQSGARRSIENGLHWDPWSARGLDDLGTLELGQHHWDAAARAFRKSLAVRPNQGEVRHLLRQAETHQG